MRKLLELWLRWRRLHWAERIDRAYGLALTAEEKYASTTAELRRLRSANRVVPFKR